MEQPEPIQATHAWCPICKAVKPIKSAPLSDASRMVPADMIGDTLKCQGCDTTIANVFVKAPE